MPLHHKTQTDDIQRKEAEPKRRELNVAFLTRKFHLNTRLHVEWRLHRRTSNHQGTVKQLLKTSFQLSNDVADLKNSVERNRREVINLKQELVKQNKYIIST